jgi:hypothetical protein
MRRHDEKRLTDEIHEHLALQTADNTRAGLSPAEARRQAVLKFGPPQVIKEQYRDNVANGTKNRAKNSDSQNLRLFLDLFVELA